MLPSPRVIVVDDDPLHLKGLADGLNRWGAACLQILFEGDLAEQKPSPHVRVIFADLHLNEGSTGEDHKRHFAVLGGLIEETIKPTGPYLIVLWTRFSDQAGELALFLSQRLVGVPKPYTVAALDKMVHLDVNGHVKDPAALVAGITEIVNGQPQVGVLMDWEERVLGATADTIKTILNLSYEDGSDISTKRLGRLLFHIAEGAVGKEHVDTDRFRAINEALLPILADHVGSLRKTATDDLWQCAFGGDEAGSALDLDDAAQLNRFSHIADCPTDSGDARGAVLELPPTLSGPNFSTAFGLAEADAASEQFGCRDFAIGDARFRWRLVQVQAACDYAQRQPGPLPYLLALEMPQTCQKQSTPPQALWTSPVIRYDDATRVIRANARFPTSLSRATAEAARAVYRIREQLLSDLIFQFHMYGARPGTISFRKKKAKSASQAGA